MARKLPLCGKESMEKSAGPGMYSVWKTTNHYIKYYYMFKKNMHACWTLTTRLLEAYNI